MFASAGIPRGRGTTGRGLEDVVAASLADIELAAMEEEISGNRQANAAEQAGTMSLISGLISGASFLGQPGAFDILRRPDKPEPGGISDIDRVLSVGATREDFPLLLGRGGSR